MTSVSPTARIPREANAPTAFVRFVPFQKTEPFEEIP
jgi:hypothetical protein